MRTILRWLGLGCLLAGCASRPPEAPRVVGIAESRRAVAEAEAASRKTSQELAAIKTLSARGDAKATLILRWLDRQDRKPMPRHETGVL